MPQQHRQHQDPNQFPSHLQFSRLLLLWHDPGFPCAAPRFSSDFACLVHTLMRPSSTSLQQIYFFLSFQRLLHFDSLDKPLPLAVAMIVRLFVAHALVFSSQATEPLYHHQLGRQYCCNRWWHHLYYFLFAMIIIIHCCRYHFDYCAFTYCFTYWRL